MSRAVIDALIHSANEAMFADLEDRCGYVLAPGTCSHGLQVRRYFEGALRALELLGIADYAAVKEFMIDAGMTYTSACYKPGDRFRPAPEHADTLMAHRKRENLAIIRGAVQLFNGEPVPIFWCRDRVADCNEDQQPDGSTIEKCSNCGAACWKLSDEIDPADEPPGFRIVCKQCGAELLDRWIAENRGKQ